MMQKYIIVKIGGSKIRKLSKENVNFAEMGGIYKFFENRGNMQYATLA